MQGGTTDGNRYIGNAVNQGAAAVVSDSAAAFDNASAQFPSLPLVQVEHGRRALAEIAANFFHHPEKRLAVSGVTGTNGKTTTAFLLDAMLNHHGRKTVLVGTIEYHVAGAVKPSPHTTPNRASAGAAEGAPRAPPRR
jgi:UDP-N-acetylmuramoyl-L-alanyl-D-glutamate--2,6-diaminopimelate ligase